MHDSGITMKKDGRAHKEIAWIMEISKSLSPVDAMLRQDGLVGCQCWLGDGPMLPNAGPISRQHTKKPLYHLNEYYQ